MSAERKRRIVPELAWDRAAPVPVADPPVPEATPVSSAAAVESANLPGPTVTTPEAAASSTGPERRDTSGDALETTTVRVRVGNLDWLDEQVKTIRRRSRSGLTRSQLLAAYLTALEELGVTAPGVDSPADLVDAIKSRISQSAK